MNTYLKNPDITRLSGAVTCIGQAVSKGEKGNMNKFYLAYIASWEAIRTNEEHDDAYVWMAFTLKKLKRYPEALQKLEQAMTLSP